MSAIMSDVKRHRYHLYINVGTDSVDNHRYHTESLSLHYVTVKPDLLAVSDEDGGVMVLNTSMSGVQAIVQGNICT